MRKFAKIMAVLLALALATPCFAKGKAVTKWAYTVTNGGKSVTLYLTFYDDGTVESSNTFDDDVDVAAYTGDTRKDGTITLHDGATAEIRGDRLFAENMVFTKVKK